MEYYAGGVDYWNRTLYDSVKANVFLGTTVPYNLASKTPYSIQKQGNSRSSMEGRIDLDNTGLPGGVSQVIKDYIFNLVREFNDKYDKPYEEIFPSSRSSRLDISKDLGLKSVRWIGYDLRFDLCYEQIWS